MRRALTALAIVTGVLACLAADASASTAAAGPLGFSIAPLHARGWFVLPAERGQHVHATLVIRNPTRRQKRIALSATDATTAAAGGFAFAPRTPGRTGAWLSLSRSLVVVPPHGSARVPFVADVPRGASPGEHYAGIVAVDEAQVRALAAARATARRRFSALVLSRAGIAVQIDLPGSRTARLSSTGASLDTPPSGPTVALHLRNAGDRLLPSTSVTFAVTRDGRPQFRSDTTLGTFLTESSLSYEVPWRGAIRPGTYRLVGWLRPAGAPVVHLDDALTVRSSAIAKVERQTSLPTIVRAGSTPWLYLACAVAGSLALGYALARRRGHRRAEP